MTFELDVDGKGPIVSIPTSTAAVTSSADGMAYPWQDRLAVLPDHRVRFTLKRP